MPRLSEGPYRVCGLRSTSKQAQSASENQGAIDSAIYFKASQKAV